MAKNSVRDFDATAANNTDIQSVNIAEGCAPSGINNAIRELMADIKNVSTGTIALESPSADSLTVTGDLTVDTNTLYVDSTNNRVGVANASPATALDVTGTVTADGLTVNASTADYIASITNGNNTDAGGGLKVQTYWNTGSNSVLKLFSNSGSNAVANFAGNGDISFYEDTGTTPKFFWDASAEALGIGTSSPSAQFHSYINTGASTILGRFENVNGEALVEIKSQNDALGILQFADSEDGNVGAVQYSHADNSMRFKSNDAERMRILAGGGITFNGDTAAANALDDYEEGTWTPSLVSGTGVTSAAGSYTKIGRVVTFDGSFTVNTNSSSTHLTFQGLPFTSSAEQRGAAVIRYTTYSSTLNFSIHVNGSSNRAGVYSGTGNVITDSQFSGKRLDFAGFYYT